MRSKFKWIFTLLLALTLQFSFAQERTITGVVSDATGTLPGANVVVKGTTRGTQTDIDGKYSIQAKTGEVLVFSFVGMADTSVTVGASNTINTTLKQGVTLTEVVIDGYRATSKKKSSVSQTTLTSDAVENRPNVSFLQSLQAEVSGLNIGTSSGQPGSGKIDVLLRGQNSINGNNDPLYVIDGMPANQVAFRGLNAEEIASITVLKDAGATAIYGNRGANGVIVINTKKGKYNSKLQVRYSGQTGFTTLQQDDYNLTNSRQILTLENQLGTGLGGTLTTDQIAAFGIDTNWKDIFWRTGVSQSHNLSFSQGSENISNFTSLGFFQQDGIVPGTDFQRFNLRSNFTGKSENGKFTYGSDLSLNFSKRNQLDQETRTDINANVLQNPLQGYLSSLPYIDPNTYVSGQQLFDDFGAPSFEIIPLMLLDYIQPGNIPNKYNEIKIFGNVSGTYKLTNALSYTTTFSLDFGENNRDFARAPQSYLAIVATPTGAQFGGLERQSNDRDLGINFLNKLNYLKTFNEKHTVDASVYLEYNKSHRRFMQYTQNGLDPRTWVLGGGGGAGNNGYVGVNGTLYVPQVLAFSYDAGLLSYFANVDYDYNGKYGFAATVRRDASYRFTEDNTWGTFYSVSARWNIDQEAFMKDSAFDQLKLRASYGVTGNQNIIDQGDAANPIYTANNLTRDLNAFAGSSYDSSTGVVVSNIANRNLQWEPTAQFDLGLDFSYKKRLTGTLDVYQKKTTKLFNNGPVSAVNGVYEYNANQDLTMYNRGVELLLKYDVFKKGDFNLDVFVNGSYNKNYLENYQGEAQQSSNIYWANGDQINSYFVVPYVGVNHENGNMLFLDINNNLTENPTDADRRQTNKSAIPVYQGGFGFNASYKGFFVSSNFSFAADVYKFDFDLTNLSNPSQIGQFPVAGELMHAWSPTNTSSNVPSLTATNIDAGDTFSDRYLIDASYIRLKNLSFGYDVPSKYLDKTFLSKVKIYTQLENYLTWTKWRGLDVDGLRVSNQGGYPSPKVITFGVDVQL